MTRLLLLAVAAGLAGLLLGPAPAQAAEKVRVEIDGLSRELRANVLANLSLQEARGDDDLTEERIRRLHTRSEEEIGLALQPFGYYRPTVQATLERDGDTWVARYVVDPGPALKVTTEDLQIRGPGSTDSGFTDLARDFPLKQGETLFHPDYEAGKGALTEYAAENGYLDAAFDTNDIRVDLDRYTADVVLHFTTGPRYLFGPVTFHQNFLNPDLLRGYVTFEPGTPLNVNELLRLQDALSDSPYFQRVEVVTRQERAEGLQVPIDVNLTASKPQRWSTGLGYGTDTGPRGSVGLELRRINRRGHRGESELRISEIEKSFRANYLIPGPYPRTDVLTFSVGYAQFDPASSESDTFLVGVGRTQARGSWREGFSLNFQREEFTVGLDSGTAEMLMPQASWSRVKADDRIYTTHGQRVQVDFRVADESVLSNVSFLQGKAEAKVIRSFADRFRFISRAQVGYTQTDQFRELPPSIRFFAGGDQSVRGFAYEDLGERDEAGNVIGGKSLLTASVEVDYRFLERWKFLEKWGIAAFYDTGNALNSLGSSLEQGAGLGLRWVSPIGPIRADVAFALSEPGTPLRFHFTVGPDL
ncbi:MAG TPA: autotransporter assembly complex family protein [Thermoanaerobaculia bacterium]|nr:autotransporter assembly complex family protein [Thermoanaerobaculia bacterium]